MESFSHPYIPLLFEYPDPTPDGFPVRLDERAGPLGTRVHLTSPGSDEIYFEVGRYPDLPVEQAIEAFLQDVTSRLEGLQASHVDQIEFASTPARRFRIRWPGKEREILFVEREDALYRIIHDPRSETNRGMLRSLMFL